MPIRNWSTTPASNNAAAPFGAPEGSFKFSEINDTIRQVMADVRAYVEDAEFTPYGHSVSFIDVNHFKAANGNYLSVYQTGRRIKAYVGVGALVGNVTSATFAGGETTVQVALDSGVLDSSMTSVAVGMLTTVNGSLPSTIPPSDLRYLVAPGGSLSGVPAGRILVAGAGVSLSDAGSGGNLEVLAPGLRLLRTVYYTTPGVDSWSRSGAVAAIEVEVQGGGGAGGGALAGSAMAAAAGGNAGAWGTGFLTAASVSAVVVVDVGTGGVPGAGALGGNGLLSLFGGYFKCAGGVGGPVSGRGSTVAIVRPSDTLASASGVDIGQVGPQGGYGIVYNGTTANSGKGADSRFGTGGPAMGSVTSTGGMAAMGYGSGGGGAFDNANVTRQGGAGGGGLVIVREYTGTS